MVTRPAASAASAISAASRAVRPSGFLALYVLAGGERSLGHLGMHVGVAIAISPTAGFATNVRRWTG
jgi:hypothetical protein